MNSKKQRKIQKQILKEARKKRQEEIDLIDNLQNNINVGSGSNKIPLLLDDTSQSSIEKLFSDTVSGQGHIDLGLNDNKLISNDISFFNPAIKNKVREKDVKKIADKKYQKMKKHMQKDRDKLRRKEAESVNNIFFTARNGGFRWTYEYSDHCLMRHNKGNLRYGYARFFDPETVQELARGEDVDLNLLRPQTFIDEFNQSLDIEEFLKNYDESSVEGKYKFQPYYQWLINIESPYGYEPWKNIVSWILNLYSAFPTVSQCKKYVKKDSTFNGWVFEQRNREWNKDSITALGIPLSKSLATRWSYALEARTIASFIGFKNIEPRYISKDFCIKNFYQDLPPLPTVGDKETNSSFIMMLPKKVCQYIMAGIPESAIIEDNLTVEHKKLLPKKDDDAYCPDQVALIVMTNTKWREIFRESCDNEDPKKGFAKPTRQESIAGVCSNNKDHPDACMHKPGFKLLALTDEAMYCYADYNWETGTKNIRSVTETIRQHCNWNGNAIDDEYLQDDFEEGHMLFNGLINIAANAIIDQNREKEVVEIESLGLPRATKDEPTEKKDYKKPIKWITTEREKRKKYIYPEGHVPQKGSPKCEHIRSGHWRNVWIGRGKDKQKSRVWIPEMYVQGNKGKK